MSTITAILSSARSGMMVSQAQAALVSRNIANAQTPGYVHEVLPISAALGGLGAWSGPPTAMRDALLERALATANGRIGYHDSQVRQLSIAEEAVNDLDGTGLGPSIEAFHRALAPLQANPGGGSERASFLTAAKSLGTAFAATRSQLDDAGARIREEAQAVVGRVNSLAAEIASIDSRIVAARAGEEANSLAARRSALVNDLSSLVSVDVIPRPDGTLHVAVGGRALVEGGKAAALMLSIDGPPARSITVNVKKNDGSVVGAMDAVGGELGGLISAHDEKIVTALDDVDQLAYDFMNAFNAVHEAGYGLDGVSGRSFFTPPAEVAGAAGLVRLADGMSADKIAAASDPSLVPGDNTNLAALSDILGGGPTVPSENSVLRVWQQIGSSLSQQLAEARSGAALEGGSRDQLANLLASEHGVSIEEEMMRMSQAQTSLEAANTVIREAQKMTDTVLGMVG
jgi:flagellar hook-associated protein 1 FlgK